MFAILETGGKQYKVAEGDILEVELLPEKLAQKKYGQSGYRFAAAGR